MMADQYGFYFDSRRCVKCHTCETACRSANDIEFGARRRRLIDEWTGEYPAVARTFFSLACMHCHTPACAAACPTGAITKRTEDGIVVVDSEKCNGCRDCLAACPYDVPQFTKDGKMQKCDFCLGIGRDPACAQSCPAEALFFGNLDELRKKAEGKTTKTMGGTTGPSIVVVI